MFPPLPEKLLHALQLQPSSVLVGSFIRGFEINSICLSNYMHLSHILLQMACLASVGSAGVSRLEYSENVFSNGTCLTDVVTGCMQRLLSVANYTSALFHSIWLE